MRPTQRLIELIAGKHHVLLRLRELGRRQGELVASGDTTSLLKLLAVKQQVIASLQDLERELAPYYEESPERRSWRSPDERVRCAEQASECNQLLREIVGMEKSSAEKMATRRNEVAEQLQHVHAATQVRNAYEAQRIIR
jgi:FlgN protein